MTKQEERHVIMTMGTHYGANAYAQQCGEEMGELMQALSKYLRLVGCGIPLRSKQSADSIIKHIAEEAADVRICMDVILASLGAEETERAFREWKLRRTMKIIADEKKKQWPWPELIKIPPTEEE
jgi:NTP pyrophosphatase (non-canonical NTP hydrolase)